MDDHQIKNSLRTENEKLARRDSKQRSLCLLAIVILLIVAFLILVGYFMVLKLSQNGQFDLNGNLGSILSAVPGRGSVVWQMSHFVLFALLGLLFPSCDFPIIILAVLWEVVEETLGSLTSPVYIPERGYVQWWTGSATDIAIDLIGFYTGKAIRFVIDGKPSQKSNFLGCKSKSELRKKPKWDLNAL